MAAPGDGFAAGADAGPAPATRRGSVTMVVAELDADGDARESVVRTFATVEEACVAASRLQSKLGRGQWLVLRWGDGSATGRPSPMSSTIE